MSLEEDLYDFLRNGDEFSSSPEDAGLDMDLGQREHEFLAKEIAAWLERHYQVITAGSHDISAYYDLR